MSSPYPMPSTSFVAEQLVGINTKIDNLTAARVTYVAGQVTALDHVNSTFAANILQPDGTSTNVAGIRTTAQFLPQVGDVVTLALSGAQIIYLPNGVALNSIDVPQLATTVTTTLTGASTTANVALSSGQNLVPDPSFENGYLTTFTAPFSLDTTVSNAHTGANAIRAVAAGSAQNMVLTPQKVPVLQGHLYRLSAWRKTDVAYNGTSGNGKLKLVKQDGTTVVASAVWTQGVTYAQVQTTFTVPSDGSVTSLQVVIGTDHTAGTLWVDDAELVDITDANAASAAAGAAQSTANTKIITFFATSAPTASETGDIWVNTSSNQTMYRWNGATWVQVQDQQIQTALTNAATAQGTANTKIITFVQSSAPTASETGDMWMDSSNGNKLFRWSGASWVSVQDTAIANALAVATAAQSSANSKVLVFAQATTPTASEVGDVWFDTDDGMKMYIWGPTKTTTRVNQANNPSFEAQAAGTVTTVTGWTVATSGTNGTVTRSIATTGGVTNGTKAFKSSASSQAASLGTWHGIQQSVVAAPGDIFRIRATFQLATASANFVPYLQVEWLNASNGVISAVAATPGSGTLTTSQLLSLTTAAAPSLTASARITLCRRTAATTGSALATSDITIDSVLFERNADAAAGTTYFDGATPGTTDSKWNNPSAAPNSTSTYWSPGVAGVNAWQLQQFRTGALASGSIDGGAIATQTILGNDAIAYGSISAPLLQSLLVLAGTIVAGNPNADHAALMTDGLHLYRMISGEGLHEVGTLAVGAFGTLMQWVDATGQLVAQVDEGGFGSFSGLNVHTDPTFSGTKLQDWLGNCTGAGNGSTSGDNQGAQNYYGFVSQTGTGITSEVGLIEIGAYVDASRQYLIIPEIPVQPSSTDGVCQVGVRDKQGTGNFTGLTDNLVYFRSFPLTSLRVTTVGYPALYRPAVTGNTRLLLTMAEGGTGSLSMPNNALTGTAPVLTLVDLGPAKEISATQNNISGGGGGGSSVQPKQQYFVELTPAGHATYGGSGSLRTDTTDVVQGLDPSGFNGQGKGYWWFSLPSITGTVDRVDWYVYCNHTYFNSGGTALWNASTVTGTGTPSFTKINGSDDQVAGYPKVGPVTITLPSSWYPSFRTGASPRVASITAGPDGTGNEIYYCRFDGPSARLRIWYTQ